MGIACASALQQQRAEAEPGASSSGIDTTITDKVFLEVGICPQALRPGRALGDKSALCFEPRPVGRIVIGKNLLRVYINIAVHVSCAVLQVPFAHVQSILPKESGVRLYLCLLTALCLQTVAGARTVNQLAWAHRRFGSKIYLG